METVQVQENNIVTPPNEEKLAGLNNEDTANTTENESHSVVVAAHYNALEEKGLTERNKSRIVHLRNFNNWMKSMLINEHMDAIRSGTAGKAVRVLDMCCGKGGDLLKWRNVNIRHLICADIAETSVDQCRSRYEDMIQRQRRDRHNHSSFTAEFIHADCTRTRLREKYKDASLQLDLVSCQFSFHYSFESLPQAECMLRNAAECLRPGGYFIGTMPDANVIVARHRAHDCKPFGNDVYQVEIEAEEPFPLFGAKYNFNLVEVVNCPEFLVHFPTLERLAKRHGLELVSRCSFEEYYTKSKDRGRALLGKMQAFETYPAFEGQTLNGEEEDYCHAKEFMEQNKVDRVGTLSKSEWEAASVYMVFAFKKMKALSVDEHGRPVYELQPTKQDSEADETTSKKKTLEEAEEGEPTAKRLKTDSPT